MSSIVEIFNSELNRNKISVGADIEFFVENNEGELIPAEDIIMGTDKNNPATLTESEGVYHCDNVMFEFGFKEGYSKEGFQINLRSALKEIEAILKAHRCSPVFVPSVDLNRSETELLKYAINFDEVGCDPFFNVYDEKETPVAYCADDLGQFRFSGGHVHIGYENPSSEMNKRIVRNMDLLYCGLVEPSTDHTGPRVKTYGAPGNYRHKKYGVEYRTPAPTWVDQGLELNIFEVAQLAVDLSLSGAEFNSELTKNARVLKKGQIVSEVLQRINQFVYG